MCVPYTAKCIGEWARIVQMDFSVAFDKANHLGILYKLCSVGIGGSVLSILTQFQSNRLRHVVVDNCRSKLVNVLSRVQKSRVKGPLLFRQYILELFSILENKVIGYADEKLYSLLCDFQALGSQAQSP